MNALIIGYGSIGKRHYDVLSNLSQIKTIDLVTKQNIDNRVCFNSLEEVSNIDSYNYFIIASETSKHFEQLKYLDKSLKNRIIFCEKPLFETKRDLKIINNQVFIGYVLRFHPLLEKLKESLKNETIISIDVKCGQYLPTWRANIDYRDSYSAKRDKGGGVLLDLSHEIDYVQWLCGKIDDIKSYQLKISDLEIDSDDFTTFIGKTVNGAIVNLSVDYISKITYRKIIVHTLNYTYSLDFINNELYRKDKQGLEEFFSSDNLERNSMFENMHTSILNNKTDACIYSEALDVMRTITIIQEQNR